MCGICPHVWINPQPCPRDRDTKMNLFLYLILKHYFEFPQIQILVVRFSNIKVFLYMSYCCNVNEKQNSCTYLNCFSIQCLKGLKANTLFCISKYMKALIMYRSFI